MGRSCQEVHDRKKAKYDDLIQQCRSTGWTVCLFHAVAICCSEFLRTVSMEDIVANRNHRESQNDSIQRVQKKLPKTHRAGCGTDEKTRSGNRDEMGSGFATTTDPLT